MKNLVRCVSMILLIVSIGAIVMPAMASGWENRYGTAALKINGQYKKVYVQNLQNDLNFVLHCGLTVDGIFGKSTKAAVCKFQKTKGLTADGIVGDKTKEALWNEIK